MNTDDIVATTPNTRWAFSVIYPTKISITFSLEKAIYISGKHTETITFPLPSFTIDMKFFSICPEHKHWSLSIFIGKVLLPNNLALMLIPTRVRFLPSLIVDISTLRPTAARVACLFSDNILTFMQTSFFFVCSLSAFGLNLLRWPDLNKVAFISNLHHLQIISIIYGKKSDSLSFEHFYQKYNQRVGTWKQQKVSSCYQVTLSVMHTWLTLKGSVSPCWLQGVLDLQTSTESLHPKKGILVPLHRNFLKRIER